ncbi:MAG TPA: type II toxin-antitoxin system Phd/YefM family antitoxin [Reyranella sp.]|nr:type II toxin-antitoxin system Phd/YefM family antitoxin [Reyranella sp.]
MKTYLLNEARVELSKLFDRALAGEPQRVTRHGKEAVMIVSEEEWRTRARSALSLGAVLARHARAGTMTETITERPWKDRPLRSEFE